jgi:uncharacterized protein
MIRLVADTNILISALFWRGNPYKVLRLCMQGKAKLVVSLGMLSELSSILIREKKFGLSEREVEAYIDLILSHSELVDVKTKVNAIKEDRSDNKFLSCAVDGRAVFVVSGDSHLLKLRAFRGIRIVSAREFLGVFEEQR